MVLALAACGDSDPTGIDQTGSFNANVTGTVTATLSGVAAASGGSTTGGWGIAFAPGATQTITLVAVGRDRPSPGTYPIVEFSQGGATADYVFVASIVAEPGVGSYPSTGGTVTIESSSTSRVTGSFTFEAERGTVASPSTVQVVGTFNATNISPGNGPS